MAIHSGFNYRGILRENTLPNGKQPMKSPARSSYYLIISALLFLFFFAWSSTYALYASWLEKVMGIDASTRGFIFMANGIAALMLQPVYGMLQDRLGTSKKLLTWVGLMLVLCTPAMAYVFPPLMSAFPIAGMAFGALYMSLAMFAGVGVVESYSERMARSKGFEFGGARLWGSIGWGAGSVVAGYFTINQNLPFYACSFAGIAFLVMLALLKNNTAPKEEKKYAVQATSSLGQSFALFAQGNFWKFTLFLFGVSGLYFLFDQQFQNYYSAMYNEQTLTASGQQAYSWLLAAQTLTEAVCLLVAPWVINRIGSRNGLILCSALMSLRVFGCSQISNVWFLSVCHLIRGIEIPVLLVAVFKYINSVFDSRYSSTIYLISFQFAQQFYSICFSAATGYAFGAYGYPSTYFVLAISAMVFTAWGIFMLPRARQDQDSGITPEKKAASSSNSATGAQTA